MLSTLKKAAFVATLINSITVQADIADCRRNNAPNWNDCDGARSKFQWLEGSPKIEESTGHEGSCTVNTNGRCAVALCWPGTGYKSATYGELAVDYHILELDCKPDDLSGKRSNRAGGYIEVRENPQSKVRAADSASAGEEHLTIEEFEAKYNNNISGNTVSKRAGKEWVNLVTKRGVPKEGVRYQVSQELDSGVEETWSNTQSVSISIALTAGVEASFFELFSAKMEITTTFEQSYSVTKGLTYKAGECPKKAIVFWEPVFDKYTGVWSDDDKKQVDIYVARQLNGDAEGRFTTVCIGSSRRRWAAWYGRI